MNTKHVPLLSTCKRMEKLGGIKMFQTAFVWVKGNYGWDVEYWGDEWIVDRIKDGAEHYPAPLSSEIELREPFTVNPELRALEWIHLKEHNLLPKQKPQNKEV